MLALAKILTIDNTNVKRAPLQITLKYLDALGIVSSKNNMAINLTYSHFSTSWGIRYVPSVGDIVVVGTRATGIPIILGFLPVNWTADQIENYGYFLRSLSAGEYATQSKMGAEIYLDRKGSLHLSTVDQEKNNTKLNEYMNKYPDMKDYFKEVVIAENNPEIIVRLGKKYDSDFTTEILSSDENPIDLEVTSGKTKYNITLDSEGNLTVNTNGNLTIDTNSSNVVINCSNATVNATNDVQIDASAITIGGSSAEKTVKGVTLQTWLNTHTHVSNVPGLDTAPPTVLADVLSTKTSIE